LEPSCTYFFGCISHGWPQGPGAQPAPQRPEAATQAWGTQHGAVGKQKNTRGVLLGYGYTNWWGAAVNKHKATMGPPCLLALGPSCTWFGGKAPEHDTHLGNEVATLASIGGMRQMPGACPPQVAWGWRGWGMWWETTPPCSHNMGHSGSPGTPP